MTAIAITGGIGAGKSQVFSILKKRGYPVLDADVIAAEAVLLPEIQNAIVGHFGSDSYFPNGQYNRKYIRDVVFSSPQKRLFLESLLHPKISQLFSEKKHSLEMISPGAWLFYEAALIFEAGRQNSFDAVVLVRAPLEVRLDRLQNLRGLDRAQAQKIMASQWDDSQKSILAQYVLENNSTPLELEIQTSQLVQKLSERFYPSPGL